MKHKGFCLFFCIQAVLYVVYNDEERMVGCFEERSLKDYILLLGYSPCFSPLLGISCDVREDKKRVFFRILFIPRALDGVLKSSFS